MTRAAGGWVTSASEAQGPRKIRAQRALARLRPVSAPVHRNAPGSSACEHLARYLDVAWSAMRAVRYDAVEQLAATLRQAWSEDRQVFLCGNGGSAANAIHLASDFFYGIGGATGRGLRVQALSANQAVMTCLANDVSYDAVYAKQLEALAHRGDLLIALSGSGNSVNIIAAIDAARRIGMTSYAILGFSGGECLRRADHAIHLALDDMQIAEDFQLIVGHALMQWLKRHPPTT